MADYCGATELKTRLDISGSGYDTDAGDASATAAAAGIDQHPRADGQVCSHGGGAYTYNSDAVDGRTLIVGCAAAVGDDAGERRPDRRLRRVRTGCGR